MLMNSQDGYFDVYLPSFKITQEINNKKKKKKKKKNNTWEITEIVCHKSTYNILFLTQYKTHP